MHGFHQILTRKLTKHKHKLVVIICHSLDRNDIYKSVCVIQQTQALVMSKLRCLAEFVDGVRVGSVLDEELASQCMTLASRIKVRFASCP